MQLTNTQQEFILHWGEMGTKWGVNRTVAQIHALLFLSEAPLAADEICKLLAVARSNVSNSIKELQAWQLIKVTSILGDRREHFTTSHDVWELFKLIVAGRKQREIDPTLVLLNKLISNPAFKQESKTTQQQIEQTNNFLKILTGWTEEMLKQEPSTLMKILQLGAKIRNFIRGK